MFQADFPNKSLDWVFCMPKFEDTQVLDFVKNPGELSACHFHHVPAPKHLSFQTPKFIANYSSISFLRERIKVLKGLDWLDKEYISI